MRFFVDNNLSKDIASGMSGFGERVEHLKDHFKANVSDTEWLEFVGSNGWVLITRDNRIRWRPAEIRALQEHKVGAFFLGGKNLKRCELIQQLVRNWPKMKELASTTTKPFVFTIPPRGTTIKKSILE